MPTTGWSLKAFREGIFDARSGKLLSDNPYEQKTEPALMWEAGWNEGNEYYKDKLYPDEKVQDII